MILLKASMGGCDSIKLINNEPLNVLSGLFPSFFYTSTVKSRIPSINWCIELEYTLVGLFPSLYCVYRTLRMSNINGLSLTNVRLKQIDFDLTDSNERNC